jgi:hypothetical protein
METQLGLTIFLLQNPQDWKEKAIAALTGMGLRTMARAGRLLIWNPEEPKAKGHGFSYCSGWKISREPLDRQRVGLGVKSVRLYFYDGEDSPTGIPENILTKNGWLPPEIPSDRVSLAIEFGQRLAQELEGMEDSPVKWNHLITGIREKTMLLTANGLPAPLGDKPCEVVRRNGFLDVPADFEIVLASEDSNDSRVSAYANTLSDAMRAFGVDGRLSTTSFSSVLTALESKDNLLDRLAGKALVVALEGRVGDGLSESESTLMDKLDGLGLRYRMFSLNNPQARFSGLNQLSDLVEAAGGSSFALGLPWPDHMKVKPFMLGVDLGHPLESGHSVLAVALCDSYGRLLRSWRCEQTRDETANPSNLIRILKLAKREVRERTGLDNHPFLLIRDGRLNDGEKVATYLGHLSNRLSFCDVSKRPDAHPFSSFEGDLEVAPAGTAFFGSDRSIAYFVSCPPPFARQMVNLQKVRFPETWDGLGLGLETLLEVLVGLSYSPCLGLKPHRSAGPVHWADGFASIAPDNCRFRGFGCNEMTNAESHPQATSKNLPRGNSQRFSPAVDRADKHRKVPIGRNAKSLCPS